MCLWSFLSCQFMSSGASFSPMSSILGPQTVVVHRVGLVEDSKLYRLPQSEDQDELMLKQTCLLNRCEMLIYGRKVKVPVVGLAGHETSVGVSDGFCCGEVGLDGGLELGGHSTSEWRIGCYMMHTLRLILTIVRPFFGRILSPMMVFHARLNFMQIALYRCRCVMWITEHYIQNVIR